MLLERSMEVVQVVEGLVRLVLSKNSKFWDGILEFAQLIYIVEDVFVVEVVKPKLIDWLIKVK